jgi:5-methylcytosine-specific restriction endonuclease McrA
MIAISGIGGQIESKSESDGENSSRNVATSRQLRKLVDRQGYRCALTGRELTPDAAFVDHVTPVSSGGSSAIENLQVVHADVNEAKGTMTQDEFIQLCRDVVAWIDRDASND